MDPTKDRTARLSTLAPIEKMVGGPVFTYFTGTRKPEQVFATIVATDIIDLVYAHLRALGKQKRIGLVLHTVGGHIQAPWPLVSLIREYADAFDVIIPRIALSAGTMIALGADRVFMTPRSWLSPVDPRTDMAVGDKKAQFEVEDIFGFIAFAKDKVGVTDSPSLVEVMKLLAQHIPPPGLGSINRMHALTRRLARQLLRLHEKDEASIETTVAHLTELLYTHNYYIGRREARNVLRLGSVRSCTEKQSDALEAAYQAYAATLEINVPFEVKVPTGQPATPITAVRAIIESSVALHTFETDFLPQPPAAAGQQPGLAKSFEGWRTRVPPDPTQRSTKGAQARAPAAPKE